MGILKKKTKEEAIKSLTKEDFDKLISAIEARQTARSMVVECDKDIAKIRGSIIASLRNSNKQMIKFAFKSIRYTNGRCRWVKMIDANEVTLADDIVLALVVLRGCDYFVDIYCATFSINDLTNGDYEAITLEEFDEVLHDAIKRIKTL